MSIRCPHALCASGGRDWRSERLLLLLLLLLLSACLLEVATVGPNAGATSRKVPCGCNCPQPPTLNLTEAPSAVNCCTNGGRFRYKCVVNHLRKAGTSNLAACTLENGIETWSTPNLVCIPDPRIVITTTPPDVNPTPHGSFNLAPIIILLCNWLNWLPCITPNGSREHRPPRDSPADPPDQHPIGRRPRRPGDDVDPRGRSADNLPRPPHQPHPHHLCRPHPHHLLHSHHHLHSHHIHHIHHQLHSCHLHHHHHSHSHLHHIHHQLHSCHLHHHHSHSHSHLHHIHHQLHSHHNHLHSNHHHKPFVR
ncbi:unnamed protein product [Boreogadus saida]